VRADRILLVDDDPDLAELMSEVLVDAGAQGCVIAHSLADLEAQKSRALAAQLAIVDVNLGATQPSGVEVHDWLRKAGFAGRVVFLTGHAQSHPLVLAATRTPGTQVLTKPITAESLADMIEMDS
jgi:DNA-binding NtrC family response regulator